MTEREVLELIWDATITPEEWVKRIRLNPSYAWKSTKYGKAILAARAMGQPAPTPVPTPVPITALGRSWIFMAEEPDRAVYYPSYYGIAFTADNGYPRPSDATIEALKRRRQRVRSWCDCHSTFPDTAKWMARELGLDGWIGEGESAPAFDVALNAGAEIVVGNLSALTEAQKALIRVGKPIWINELYLNQDAGRAGREDWMNLPVAGRCIAAYDASGENPGVGTRFPVSEYLSLGKFQSHRDSFYDPGSTDNDRRLLP